MICILNDRIKNTGAYNNVITDVKALQHVRCCSFLSKVVFFLDSVSHCPPVSVWLCLLRRTKGEISGSEAARGIFIHIIAEWWRHALTKVTPQVLKSPTSVFFLFPLSFFYLIISTPHLHSSFLPVHLHHFAPHHLLFSSAVKWSLRLVWSPDQLPPLSLASMCQSRSVPDCLRFFSTVSHSYAHLAVFSHSVFLFCSYSSVTYMFFFYLFPFSLFSFIQPSLWFHC